MDFRAFVDTCAVPCAVLSVEKAGGSGYGAIRIVCANEPYKRTMGPAYYDGMPYYELVPKDLKFEDFCYRAALRGERMHAYVETKALNCWTDQQMIPLNSDRDDIGYCQFLFEFTQTADPSRMASVSMETAEAVIEASLALLGARDFKEGVMEVQRNILRIAEGGSCRIILTDHEQKTAPMFCEEFGEGADRSKRLGDGIIPYEIVESWEGMMGVSNCVIVKNEHDMADLERRNPAWVASMRSYLVTSLVLIPLRRSGAIIGWLYVVNYNVEKTALVKELLELMAFILGSELANHLLLEKLEIMSNVDALTGIPNRNAMMRRMREIAAANGESVEDGETVSASVSDPAAKRPFGVINLDLNGLKTVNDRDGHEAGDRLLVEAAEVLQKVFHREDLFRTGGDEFIVLTPGITRDAFDRKVERLYADMHKNARVSFAIGPYWSDGTVSVREAFLSADARMYADKRAYYADHPDERRA